MASDKSSKISSLSQSSDGSEALRSLSAKTDFLLRFSATQPSSYLDDSEAPGSPYGSSTPVAGSEQARKLSEKASFLLNTSSKWQQQQQETAQAQGFSTYRDAPSPVPPRHPQDSLTSQGRSNSAKDVTRQSVAPQSGTQSPSGKPPKKPGHRRTDSDLQRRPATAGRKPSHKRNDSDIATRTSSKRAGTPEQRSSPSGVRSVRKLSSAKKTSSRAPQSPYVDDAEDTATPNASSSNLRTYDRTPSASSSSLRSGVGQSDRTPNASSSNLKRKVNKPTGKRTTSAAASLCDASDVLAVPNLLEDTPKKQTAKPHKEQDLFADAKKIVQSLRNKAGSPRARSLSRPSAGRSKVSSARRSKQGSYDDFGYSDSDSDASEATVAVDSFDFIGRLGKGSFGEVRLVRHAETGVLYAMKILDKRNMMLKNQVRHVRSERDVLAKSSTSWVVKLVWSFQDNANLYLVMEYLPGGDLLNHLMKRRRFTEDMARFYVAETLLAIERVHRMGYVHRDVKPDNILLDKEGHIKVSDFGLSNAVESKTDTAYGTPRVSADATLQPPTSQPSKASKPAASRRAELLSTVGTPDYIAPEVFSKKGYGQSCDLWSLGIVLYELLLGFPPFYGSDPMEAWHKIVNWKNTFRIPNDATLSEAARSLIHGLICDASDRLSIKQIKKHPFFESINWRRLRKTQAPIVPQISDLNDTGNFDQWKPLSKHKAKVRTSDQDEAQGAFGGFTFRRLEDSDDESKDGYSSRSVSVSVSVSVSAARDQPEHPSARSESGLSSGRSLYSEDPDSNRLGAPKKYAGLTVGASSASSSARSNLTVSTNSSTGQSPARVMQSSPKLPQLPERRAEY